MTIQLQGRNCYPDDPDITTIIRTGPQIHQIFCYPHPPNEAMEIHMEDYEIPASPHKLIVVAKGGQTRTLKYDPKVEPNHYKA